MLSFYMMPSVLRDAAAFISVIGFAVEIDVLLETFRYRQQRGWLREVLPELAVSAWMVLFAFLFSAPRLFWRDELIVSTRFDALRWIVGLAAVALLAAKVALEWYRTLPTIVAVLTVLPLLDGLPGYPYLYLAAEVFLLVRCVVRAWKLRRVRRESITRDSIKEAIDTLQSGVLYYNSSGTILLANERILSLVHGLSGRNWANGAQLWSFLTTGKLPGGGGIAARLSLPDGVLIRTADEAWRFTRTELPGKPDVYELHASDMTETDALNRRIESINDSLAKTGDGIRTLLDNFEEIKRAEELQEARRRSHDLVDNHLSVLQRASEEETRDFGQLIPLVADLLHELRQPETETPAERALRLQEVFAQVHIRLELTGELPKSNAAANLLLTLLREAATNAIRHAGADVISAAFVHADGECKLTVTNNGRPPVLPIVEGGGITGMRSSLEASGGRLEIDASNGFRLTAWLGEDAI